MKKVKYLSIFAFLLVTSGMVWAEKTVQRGPAIVEEETEVVELEQPSPFNEPKNSSAPKAEMAGQEKLDSDFLENKESTSCTANHVEEVKDTHFLFARLKKERTGNSSELEEFLKNLQHKELEKEFIDLAEDLLSSKPLSLDERDRQKLVVLTRQVADTILLPSYKRLRELKKIRRLTEEEQNELEELLDRLRPYQKKEPWSKFIDFLTEDLGEFALGRRVKKFTLKAHYFYSSGFSSPKKTLAIEGVRVPALLPVEEVSSTLFGGGREEKGSQRKTKTVLGRYEDFVKTVEERREVLRIREDRDQRIESGEELSKKAIAKAKKHHERYKYYYRQMMQHCYQGPMMYSPTCPQAQKDFRVLGKGVHMRKMFNLLELAKKDKDKEKVEKIRRAREKWLGMYQDQLDAESLFEEDEEYGEFADQFPRAGNDEMGSQQKLSKRRWQNTYGLGNPGGGAHFQLGFGAGPMGANRFSLMNSGRHPGMMRMSGMPGAMGMGGMSGMMGMPGAMGIGGMPGMMGMPGAMGMGYGGMMMGGGAFSDPFGFGGGVVGP